MTPGRVLRGVDKKERLSISHGLEKSFTYIAFLHFREIYIGELTPQARDIRGEKVAICKVYIPLFPNFTSLHFGFSFQAYILMIALESSGSGFSGTLNFYITSTLATYIFGNWLPEDSRAIIRNIHKKKNIID